MLMPHSPLVRRPGFRMGLTCWRMGTIQDQSEKSAQVHGKDGGWGWACDQEPGWGYSKGGTRVFIQHQVPN